MAAKSQSTGEVTGSSKSVREAIALSNEASPGGPDSELGKLSNDLIKSMANEVAFMQVQSQKSAAETSILEAKKKKMSLEQEIGAMEQKTRVSAPISSLGGLPGIGPISQMAGGNAEVIKAALGALESDEARLKYLDENKHLLYGGSPGLDAFQSLIPKPASKGDSDIGSILAGLAQMQLVQGQEMRNNLLMQKQLASQSSPTLPTSTPTATDDTKLLVSAVMKLAEAFSGGQSQMQQQISALREEKNKTEQAMWEKYFNVQQEAAAERQKYQEEKYLGVIGSLEDKLNKIEQSRANDGGVRGELAQIKNLIERSKDLGLNLTAQTADDQKAQRDYDLELAKLNMQKEIMLGKQRAEAERAASFNNKINTFAGLLSFGHDAMTMKKKLQGGNNQVTQNLSSGL